MNPIRSFANIEGLQWLIKGYEGMYVDESRWNGSNIFELLGIGGKIMVDETLNLGLMQQSDGCQSIPESMTS